MTNEELQNLIKEIVTGIETGADMVGVIAPGLIPFIVIGKAFDKIIPGLATAVKSWVEGNPPTDEEKAKLKEMLAVLGDENLP